tara:strand:- start:9358 stop:10302 length:945 start_codon:yes stop_codon:yes gene_type:complete
MAQTRFSGFPATIKTAGDDIDLRQLQQFTVSPGTNISSLTPMGDVDRAVNTVASAMPEITFSSRDLETVLGGISSTLGVCATDGGSNSLLFRWQERADCGTFEPLATATHVGWYGLQGLVCPDTLSASQGDESGATISCKAWITSADGHTDPLTHVDGVDLSEAGTPTPAFNSRYYLGPVTVGGSLVEGISDVSINFGHNVSSPLFDGDVFPRTATIDTRQPTITFTTAKGDVGAALSVFGRSSGAVSVYLIKGASNGTRVALANAEHISLSCTAGLWHHDSASVSDNGDGTVSFMVIPTGVLAQSLTATVPTS